jgi:hypothetical protein
VAIAPQFTQSANAPTLYWLDGGAWRPSGAFGLVLFDATNAPATLTLAQSWTEHVGLYVAIAEKPAAASEAGFAAAVAALVARAGPNARFAWLDSPVDDGGWGRRILYVAQNIAEGTAVIDRPSVFALGAYRFSVSAHQSIAPTDSGFSIASAGRSAPDFLLSTDAGAWPLTAASAGATVLSISGAAAGVFSVCGTLSASGAVSDYERLDVGFRFGAPDRGDPQATQLISLRYPLFDGAPTSAIAMVFQCDPVGVLLPERTRLAYRDVAPAQNVHYTSQLGYDVALAPNGVDPACGLPAGFAFHKRPNSLTALPGDDPLYLAPIGPFLMNVGAPPQTTTQPAARLTGGVAGTEYFGFSTGAGAPIVFAPGQQAFAENFPPQNGAEAQEHEQERDGPLTLRATTAFARLAPPVGGQAWYFAQPTESAFFNIRPSSGDDALLPYLVFLELVTTDVTASAAQPYPLIPYAGVVGGDFGVVQALEAQILSPLRRARLGLDASETLYADASGAQAQTADEAVTPQGVLARFQDATLSSLILSPPAASTLLDQLAFNTPSAAFRGALQSNQLFLVACDGALLLDNCDLNYWITQDVLGDLARLSGAETVPRSVIDLLAQDARAPQSSRAAFEAMLEGILTGANAQYIPIVVKYAPYFQIAIEGWRFRVSPSLWADQATHPTIMIFKFATGALYDFVQNTDAWAWPAVGALNGSTTNTQAALNAIIADAIADVETNGAASRLYNFVVNIVGDPGWMGVVFLNANVPFSSVPPELSGLAAGIRPDEFVAHHVGLSVTPTFVDTRARTLSQDKSATFGLINYNDPDDIAHIDGDFDFKVLLLQILFENSAIAQFAGKIELFVNRLFGARVTLYHSAHYNNIILDGSYQRQGASGHYAFSSSDANIFGADSVGKGSADNSTVLTQTEIDGAQFVTATTNTETSAVTQCRFLLQGRLRFAALDAFDAFSFGPTLDRDGAQIADGYLAFSGLSVDMSFPSDAPENRAFRFNLDQIAFDPASSKARATSFFQRFPLQIGGLIRGDKDAKPKDAGYLGVETPLSQPGFSGDWYGLTFNVDLGTLGALSSAPALSASLLVAWCPGLTATSVNIGLKLPGLESAKSILPVQGVIDLGFQAIDLTAQGAAATPPDPAYILRFRNFFLRFLGWKFPPGQNAIALFGDPDAATQDIATDRGALGWYAAYAKKE